MIGEGVRAAGSPEVEEREVTCTNKVSIVFCSRCGLGVAQPQVPLNRRVFISNILEKERRPLRCK